MAGSKTSGTRTGAAGSGGKRGGKSASKTGAAKTGGKKAPAASKPFRREAGALVCLLLAIFSAFGYFNIRAPFIDLFVGGGKGLIGYGFWFLPPALLLAGAILLFHRGRPVRLRVWCALLMPVLVGCLLHLFLAGEAYAWGAAGPGELWDGGREMACGGVVSGFIAMALAALFSKAGAVVLVVVSAAVLVMAAANVTVVDIVDYLRSRPHPEYEEQEAPPPRRREPQPEAESPLPKRRRGRKTIDIPLDDGPAEPIPEAEPESEPAEEPAKKRPVGSRAAVPTPDEILAEARESGEREDEKEEAAEPFVRQPFAAAKRRSEPERSEEPIVPPVQTLPSQPPLEIEREPAVGKAAPTQAAKAAETAQAAVEVALEAAKQLGQSVAEYEYPSVSLLREGDSLTGADAIGELRANQTRLSETIRSFGIEAKITNVTRGPSVTRYELELDQGVRLNKLTNLADDIALALGAAGVRIAPIPDKISMVGIEVPNKLVSPVYIRSVIDSPEFQKNPSKVSFAVGKDIGGSNIVGNIAKLPHLLIAGTTGSGKSVCTNSLIISLLYKASPEEVRLIMVDPKMVELGIYNGIPHLLIPVVTDPKKAAGALQWAVVEMMKRYRTFSEVGVRKLEEYNAKAAKSGGEMEKMPSIVVVIDELADLMLVAAKEVEESICRVAQMGRAAGMHLVIATQRPSADVITGLMKANIPSRIAFAVASSLESRIILDTTGAEKLVGRGDMLYFPLGSGKPTRVQGCLISDEEVANVVDFIKQRSGSAQYDEEVIHEIEKNAAEKEKSGKGVGGVPPEEADSAFDELLPAAIEVVVETGQASVSMLQRRLKLGYSRAARLVDQMEEKGVVGPFEGSKPRQLLITKEQWQEMQFREGLVDAAPDLSPVPDELEFEGDAIPQSRDLPPFDMDE